MNGNIVESKDELSEDNICTLNAKDHGPFIGDGGNPLVVDGIIVGVSSKTLILPHLNVYTKTYSHLKCIQAIMAQMV